MKKIEGFKVVGRRGFSLHFHFMDGDYSVEYVSEGKPLVTHGTPNTEAYFQAEGLPFEKVEIPEDLALLVKMHHHSGEMLASGLDAYRLLGDVTSAADR